jgi:hypothetical protein
VSLSMTTQRPGHSPYPGPVYLAHLVIILLLGAIAPSRSAPPVTVAPGELWGAWDRRPTPTYCWLCGAGPFPNATCIRQHAKRSHGLSPAKAARLATALCFERAHEVGP